MTTSQLSVRLAFVCAFSFVLAACGRPQKPQPQTEKLEAALALLNLDNPQKDMLEHVKKGDYRPVGVCGFACYAPGLVDQSNGPNEIVIKYKLRDVPGTTDAVESLQHRDLIRKATRYAETYNLALKDWLEYQRKLDKKN